MRLIDADALVEFACEGDEKTKTEGARMLLTFLRNIVELQPTIDAVPVIRCNDCANFNESPVMLGYCMKWGLYTKQDGFCYKAEQAENAK